MRHCSPGQVSLSYHGVPHINNAPAYIIPRLTFPFLPLILLSLHLSWHPWDLWGSHTSTLLLWASCISGGGKKYTFPFKNLGRFDRALGPWLPKSQTSTMWDKNVNPFSSSSSSSGPLALVHEAWLTEPECIIFMILHKAKPITFGTVLAVNF